MPVQTSPHIALPDVHINCLDSLFEIAATQALLRGGRALLQSGNNNDRFRHRKAESHADKKKTTG